LNIGMPAFMSTPIAALTCASVTQSQGATESANAEDNGIAEASSVVAKHFRRTAVYSPPANNNP
jgi:hypothetical protein